MKSFILWLLPLFIACTPQHQEQDVSLSALKEFARLKGDTLSLQAQKALGSQLKQALAERGPSYAVQFCHLAASPILDTLKTDMNVDIRRASLRARNPKDLPTEKEEELLETFTQQISQNKRPGSIVEVLDGASLLYARPILLHTPLCLNCHGQVGTQISSETHQLIKELYPEDLATGHTMGDLRGMWSIRFDTQALAEYLRQLP